MVMMISGLMSMKVPSNQMVRKMAGESLLIKRIVRSTGLSRKLVRQILRGEREDVFRIRESSLTPWLPRLEQEWNGAELWRRLRADGFRGSLRVVGEWATRQRRAEQAVPNGTGKSPPARRIARLPTKGRDHLSRADAVQVANQWAFRYSVLGSERTKLPTGTGA
ncbi:hypothetical protein [Paracoccus sp. TOH]|uniref:hypothetical protein n=1 Tax=Paracoccus sp. TOH TaxID=1263728 RepID=UPI0025B07635|nr:hypothetical protein [Paracoccus sp. TOH]WJS87492.1 hypothetical protein NBE95_22310 [Paracoccus sp. TOH]